MVKSLFRSRWMSEISGLAAWCFWMFSLWKRTPMDSLWGGESNWQVGECKPHEVYGGFPEIGGYPNSWRLFVNGKIRFFLSMDDDYRGTPSWRNGFLISTMKPGEVFSFTNWTRTGGTTLCCLLVLGWCPKTPFHVIQNATLNHGTSGVVWQ